MPRKFNKLHRFEGWLKGAEIDCKKMGNLNDQQGKCNVFHVKSPNNLFKF